jgi:hypothetical protein
MICNGYSFVREQLVSPILLGIGLQVYVFASENWWAMSALPLMFLGWIACAPNLNLADGCLPVVFTFSLFAFGILFGSANAILAGLACGTTWAVASIEALLRMKAYPPPE